MIDEQQIAAFAARLRIGDHVRDIPDDEQLELLQQALARRGMQLEPDGNRMRVMPFFGHVTIRVLPPRIDR